MIQNNRDELSFLVAKRMNLEFQIEQITQILNIYEQLDQQRARMGESSLFRLQSIPKNIIEDFLTGDWLKKVDQYKTVYAELFLIESAICRLSEQTKKS